MGKLTDNERINFLLKIHYLNPKQFSEALGLNRVDAIYNVMKGRNGISRKLASLIVEKFPEVSIEWLLNGTGKPFINEQKAIITPDDNSINVMLVPIINRYDYLEYVKQWSNDEYIETLHKLPFLTETVAKGTYRCFEVGDDSMEDGSINSYPEGTVVLCRDIIKDNWATRLNINDWDFVIVHPKEGVVLRRITKVDNNEITLHCLNPMYDDTVISIDETLQIMSVVKVQRSGRR